MFDTRTRLFSFACLKDAAGAALKNAAPGSDPKKIGSGSATLLCRYQFVTIISKNCMYLDQKINVPIPIPIVKT